jgi:hypothetical protein
MAYILEYVSGVIPVIASSPEYYYEVDFWFANRGGIAEHARAILGNGQTIDLGDLNVDPGDINGYGWVEEDPCDVSQYWARIYTSSANVVPNVVVTAGSPTNPHNPWLTYIAPNDFAVFQLPEIFSLPQGPGGLLPTRGRRTGPIKLGKISR